MKRYFLVARYKDNEKLEVIKINTNWYLLEKKEPQFLMANPLEAIDLVTTRFSCQKEMLLRMFKNGYITSLNCDLFIASVGIRKGKKYLKTLEVIYKENSGDRINDFRDIALASLENNIDKEVEKVKKIFDKLACKVYYDDDFSEYLGSTFTNIYDKVMKLYVYDSNLSCPNYGAKYNNYWVLSSYTLIRNIIEAMNRYDRLKGEDDLLKANASYINGNAMDRKTCEDELILKLDKNYIEGQFSLFDEEIVNYRRILDNRREYLQEQNDLLSIDEVQEFDGDIIKFIFQVLESIPTQVFKHIDRDIVVSEKYFSTYMDADSKVKFLGLPKKCISLLYVYILHREKYEETLKYQQNTMELEGDLRDDIRKIKKYLSKDGGSHELYNWCQNYLKCIKFQKIASLYDEEIEVREGKVFWKKG